MFIKKKIEKIINEVIGERMDQSIGDFVRELTIDRNILHDYVENVTTQVVEAQARLEKMNEEVKVKHSFHQRLKKIESQIAPICEFLDILEKRKAKDKKP